MNVRPLSRSRISVSIGATVPRSIHLHRVPRDIVEIYPQFRDHRFIVVEDEIVIVHPRTHRIVTTLSMSGGKSASRSNNVGARTPSSSRITLSQDDRQVIRRVVREEPTCRLEQRLDFFIGLPIPRTVQVCEFPEEIVAEIPEIRSHRYVIRDGHVALVDPRENRVIEVID